MTTNHITQRSRELRNNMTDAEAVFWDAVKGKQTGYRFVRQKPIRFILKNKQRFFIADFLCHALKLVIEIDGRIHETQQEYDEARGYVINELGYKVIRFKNEEVLSDIRGCLKKLPVPLEEGKGVGGLGLSL